MPLKRIDRYEIKEELGRGGMATVFRAIDPRFGREVALKILPRHYLHDPTFIARFEREAQTIATLEHPAIVPVYDFGEEDSQPFLVMRLMRGGSLVDRIKAGPLPLRQAAEILTRLAPALDNAHSHAIIHRDLKPQNILFDRWEKPYLADFGIVKLVEESVTNLTASGGAVGTPAYMSPEQVSGVDELDGRSDTYALGVILFEMLTGKIPYNARTPMSLALKHITEPVPIILESNHSLPVETQVTIDRAMAKDRAERYSTAVALAAAVSELAAGTPEAPFVRPGTPISVTPLPISPDPAAELTDESEETQLRKNVEAAALAAAAIISPVLPDTPTEQDQLLVEHLAEKESEAVIMPPIKADTPTELEPAPAEPPIEDESGEMEEAIVAAAAIAHDTPTELESAPDEQPLEDEIDAMGAAVAAAAAAIAHDTPTELEPAPDEQPLEDEIDEVEMAAVAAAAAIAHDTSTELELAPAELPLDPAAAPNEEGIAWLAAFWASSWRYLALIPLLLLTGVGGFYALSAGLAGSANTPTPTPSSTQLPVTDENEIVPPLVEITTVTPSRTPSPSATTTATPSRTPTSTMTRTPMLTRTPDLVGTLASMPTEISPTVTRIIATNTIVPATLPPQPTSPPQPTDPPPQPTSPPQPTDPPPQPTDPPPQPTSPPQPTDPPPKPTSLPQPTDPPPEPTDPPSPPTRGPTPEPP